MLNSVRMQPRYTPLTFDSIEYMAALANGKTKENFFGLGSRTAVLHDRINTLGREVGALRRQLKESQQLIGRYEKALPLKRSVDVDGVRHIGIVMDDSLITRRGTASEITR